MCFSSKRAKIREFSWISQQVRLHRKSAESFDSFDTCLHFFFQAKWSPLQHQVKIWSINGNFCLIFKGGPRLRRVRSVKKKKSYHECRICHECQIGIFLFWRYFFFPIFAFFFFWLICCFFFCFYFFTFGEKHFFLCFFFLFFFFCFEFFGDFFWRFVFSFVFGFVFEFIFVWIRIWIRIWIRLFGFVFGFI